MTTSTAKALRTPFEEHVMQYIDEEFEQGRLFGPEEPEPEALVQGYFRLKGKRKAIGLKLILERKDCEKILLRIVTLLGGQIAFGHAPVCKSIKEIKEIAEKSSFTALLSSILFIEKRALLSKANTLTNLKK